MTAYDPALQSAASLSGARVAARPDDISKLAATALSAETRAVLEMHGFELSTIQAFDSSASCDERLAAEPFVQSLSFSRPSNIPDVVVAGDNALRGETGQLRIGLFVTREKRGRTIACPEADWSVPAQSDGVSIYARAHCTHDGRWEYNMSRQVHQKLREEVTSLPIELWRALFKALDEVGRAYERQLSAPPGPNDPIELTSAVFAISGPWGMGPFVV